MAQQDDDALREFKEVFLSLTELFGFISNDEVFKKAHGFSMPEFISLRRSCATKIRGVAGDIERIVKSTGIAKTTGGAVGVASGAAALGGLILAPFTAGASLALTVGGIAAGVASATTTITAAIIKDKEVNSKAKAVKRSLDSLKEKDEVVGKLIKELQKKLKKIQSLYKEKSVMDFIKDGVKITKWIGKAVYSIGYKGYKVYSTMKAVKFANAIFEIIQADVYAMRGVAVGMSAPKFGLFGKTLIVAGSTTAKVVSGALGVLGIGMGIWEIVDGAKDINGSEHADAYRKAAKELDAQTDSYVDILGKIKA